MPSRLTGGLLLAHIALLAALLIALAIAGALDGATAVIISLGMLASAAMSAAFLSRAQAPLRRIVPSAQAIAAGDLAARMPEDGTVETSAVAAAFNAMAQSLEERLTGTTEESDRLRAALDSSVDGVLVVDSEGLITFANLAARGLFEQQDETLVGKSVAWVLPDEQVVDALRASREEGRPETCVIERPGRQYLQVFSTPIIGGEWAALLMFHDISDVRRTEQVRRDFVANVSHELRTPLASIKAVIETLQSGALEDKAAARDFLARAETEADRLVQMVEELLELSRIESGVVPLLREPVALARVLEEAADRMMPQALQGQVELLVDVGDDLPAVSGDADRLERAAVNLIHNAIKFTPAGGSIYVSAASENGSVVVRVQDTGEGIAKEDLPRVFERFYKTDRSRESVGTGLGLAVVRHTIEAHGGAVGVESEQGHGATFSFALPLASNESP